MYIKLSKEEVGIKHNGTSLSGYLPEVRYSDLVKAFGEPTFLEPSGDNKIQKEWVFEDEDGNTFTVYDYKTYDEFFTMNENTDWHVGSKVPAHEFIHWATERLGN